MEIIQVTELEEARICADIWLEASLAAHDFIPEAFWRSNHAAMGEQYLPAADVYAARDATLVGFAALHRRSLAALFVLPAWWGRGVGSALVRHVQSIYSGLHLTVYEKNTRAMAFYEKHGFTALGKQICPHTGKPEYRMAWQKASAGMPVSGTASAHSL